MINRRTAIKHLAQFLAASPLAFADRKYGELKNPIFDVANVFDMQKLAKAKLDPLAWDYLDEGAEDETALRDNRAGFDRIVIRPHFLQHDVKEIDISTKLFGKRLAQPSFFVQPAERIVYCRMGCTDCICRGRQQHDDDREWWRDGSRPGKRTQGLVAITTAAEFRQRSR